MKEATASTDPHHPGLGWSLKQLHRLLMTSTTYRQSSARDPERKQRDPDNQFYARRTIQRLDGEAILGSFLAVSGALSERRFGQIRSRSTSNPSRPITQPGRGP